MSEYRWNAELAWFAALVDTRHMLGDLVARGGMELTPKLSVEMADNRQRIRLAGLRFNHQLGFDPEGEPIGQEALVLVWESRCMFCGAPYEFRTKGRPSYLTRTCEEHRGLRKETPKASPRPVPALPPMQRFGKHERHVLEMIEDEFADDKDADLDLFLRWCVSKMPKPAAGKRDVRRFEISRAVMSLAKRPNPAVRIEGDRIRFLN